jgi:5'-methylthioadenosine phosphorylase
LAAVTDFDCWHPDHATITVDMVIRNLQKNIENAKKILIAVFKNLPHKRMCLCGEALKSSIITNPKLIPAKVKKDLDIIIGKYI